MELLTADNYQRLEHRDQIYKEPDTYLGSIDKINRNVKLLDLTEEVPSFKDAVIDYPAGCERIFLEILYNATDNVIESRKRKHDIGSISITMNNTQVTIRNGGVPIPIEINKTENLWVPEMIFGTLLTSGQYKKTERTGSGKNGYGSKLTNIFSKYFKCVIGNPYDGKLYTQEWRNNMIDKSEPVLTNYKGEPFVEITYDMDFQRFGYLEYPKEVQSLYAGFAAEIAFTLKVPISFNSFKFDKNDILSFKELTGLSGNYLVHYEYPEGTQVKHKKLPNGSMVNIPVDPSVVPLVELCLIDTPDNSNIYSYANSANTKVGGVHVNEVFDLIGDTILKTINDSIKSSKEDKLTRKQALNKGDLKRHLSLIISCNLVNPRYTDQSKVELTSPKPKIKFDDKALKSISNWDMVVRLYADLEAKLNKGKGNKKKYLDMSGYEKATYAGVKDKNLKCILYEVEGLSAMGYAYGLKSEMTEEQRDYVGLFAQMGKPLNVMTAKLLKLMESKKYQRLISALGLEEGIDYTKDENFERLNYGGLALLNDSDVDGKHIAALVLNMLYCRYKTLLQRNYVVLIRTPIIRIWSGKKSYKFYSHTEYVKFMEQHPECSKYQIKYYKGLASSNSDEVKEEAKTPKVVQMIYDDTAPEYFNLAFSNDKGQTDKRKEWIDKFQLLDGIEDIEKLPISKFLNYELLQHAAWSMARTIPRFDGLKNGYRKIVYGSYDQWGTSLGSSTKQIKTSRAVYHISGVSNYHHGEKSLIDTINGMVLQYPGSNNLRYFVPEGQFGTRNEGGKDAGDARYTYLYPEWWWPYMFRKEDWDFLPRVKDEGSEWEPEFYLPILPIHMINGCLGIGTGSSTFIPNFNPIDLVNYIKEFLVNSTGQSVLSSTTSSLVPCSTPLIPCPSSPLVPWYRDFKGKILIQKRYEDKPSILNNIQSPGQININFDLLNNIPKDPKESTVDKFEDPVESNSDDEAPIIENLADLETNERGDFPGESSNKREGLKMVTTGLFEIKNEKEIIVTEIPIGKTFVQYAKFLELLKDKKIIKDYKKTCKDNEARFIIYGYKGNPTLESLGLIKSFSLTNMVLLDEKDKRHKYDTPNQLLEEWVKWRLPFYQKRKDHLLKVLVEDINQKIMKIQFVTAVINGTLKGYIPGETIVVMNKPKKEILEQMKLLKTTVTDEILTSTKLTNCTADEVQKLHAKIMELKNTYDGLLKTSIIDMYMSDINEFVVEYLKKFPEEKSRLK